MSVIGSNILAGASGQGGYFIDRSVRLRYGASAYLSRGMSTANTTTWTVSFWFKTSLNQSIGSGYGAILSLFESVETTGAGRQLGISQTNAGGSFQIAFYKYAPSTYTMRKIPAMVFRDPSAWYHAVFVWNTTSAVAEDRAQIWINGVRVTAWTTNTNPAQNEAWLWSMFTNQFIGTQNRDNGTVLYPWDGYLTEVNFIDGQALTPSDFGEYDADSGVWKPKKYVGTYGTNGFYLNFSDNTSTTTLGYDYSGNGNNWTANNISLTSGVTYDSMTDVPTLTSETAANYAVLSPIDKYSSTIGTSEANLKLISTSGGSFQQLRNTIGMTSGKYYMEWVIVSLGAAGRTGASLIRYDSTLAGASTSTTTSWCYSSTGDAYANNVTTSLSTGAITTGTDVVMYAFDADTGKFWMGKNGTWANSGDPATGANPIYSGLTNGPYFFGGWNYNTSDVVAFNFGQRPFAYTPPTGFKALNTFNLPDSTIVDGSQHFDVLTHTGNGGSLSVTGLNFQPDFVWGKARNTSSYHRLHDVVRGSDNTLATNVTDAEVSGNGIVSFDSNGFTLDSGSNINQVYNYVDWSWKAGGTAVSNTDGSITSSVSANTTSGFSIVTYTGNGTNGATVGHGLGVKPDMVIIKKRANNSATNTGNWIVQHKSLTAGVNANSSTFTLTSYTNGALYLNATNGQSSYVFDNQVNGNTDTFVAYCFAEVPGFSKFGSYTGNGSADGPFVFCGFRPKFVLVKGASNVSSWQLLDTSRNTYNAVDNTLWADLSSAEGTGYARADLLSNGFKVRAGSGADPNVSGATYIYAAFAENPTKLALAR